MHWTRGLSPQRALTTGRCSKSDPNVLLILLSHCFYLHMLRNSVSPVCNIFFLLLLVLLWANLEKLSGFLNARFKIWYSTVYCTTPVRHQNKLYYTILQYNVMHHTVIYGNTLYYTTLKCSVLHHTCAVCHFNTLPCGLNPFIFTGCWSQEYKIDPETRENWIFEMIIYIFFFKV